MFTHHMPEIAEDVCDRQTHKVIKIEMGFGVDPSQCHGFTAVSVEYTAWRFIMDVDDLGFSNIGNLLVMFLRPLRPRQIFEPGQCFIVLILFPQTFANGGVGVIAKRCRLTGVAHIGIPLMIDLLLGIL